MTNYIRKFLAYGVMNFKTGMAYRMQYMSTIIITPIILLMNYSIWYAVFANSGQSTILGYSFSDIVTYYVISMVIGHFIYNSIGNEISEKVTYGDLNQDLLKPFSIFSQSLAMTISDRFFAFVSEVIPVFVISLIFFDIHIASLSSFALFIVSCIFALVLNFLIGFLMGMISFWMSKIDSIQWFVFFFVRFASGEYVPLDFLGTAAFAISRFFPFYYLRYGVIQIFLAKQTIFEAGIFLLIQLFWILGFYLLIKIIWHFALRKYGGSGG
jgi:ABC-2 type transport system permease protein